MKKYVRVDGDNVEIRTVHQTLTSEEFEERKQAVKDRIERITEQISELREAELPDYPSNEQMAAVADFNEDIRIERELLQSRRKDLRDQEREMNEV
jgi:hypothetical protein